MKLSETTQNILKNYSTINQSIYLKEGSRLSTISVMRNILAAADVSEEFPVDFCIYDLGKFLNLLSIYPELTFHEKYVEMSNGAKKYKFMAAEPSIIVFTENTFEGSKSVVMMEIDFVIPNCPRYLPDMNLVQPSKYIPRKGKTVPTPEWKTRDYIKPLLPNKK